VTRRATHRLAWPHLTLLVALSLGRTGHVRAEPAHAPQVTVYIVDSGVRVSHRAVGQRTKPGGASAGRDFVHDAWGRTRGADDCEGHGTALASLVRQPSAEGRGIRMFPVRVADCDGSSSPSRVLAALAWIARWGRRPALVLASLDVGDSALVRTAAEQLVARGIAVVAAAGNTVADACLTAPGGAPSVITVASVRADGRAATFSNLGPCIDLFAAGEELTVASIASDRAMRVRSGSSFAAALVAGALARELVQHPGASPSELLLGLLALSRPSVQLSEQSAQLGTTRLRWRPRERSE